MIGLSQLSDAIYRSPKRSPRLASDSYAYIPTHREENRSDMRNQRSMKIYVAGPYTPDRCTLHDAARVAHKNTLRAVRIGIDIMKKGHVPFIPHLTHFIHLETDDPLPSSFYKRYDKAWLRYCDALFFIGPSKGANEEKTWAKQHGLRIFQTLSEIPKVRR